MKPSRLFFCFLLSASPSMAASVTWNEAGPTNNWNTTDANWTGGASVFTNGDSATFGAATGETVTVDAAGVTPASTAITGNGSYTLSGGSILGGTLAKGGTGTLTLSAANSFSSVGISSGTLSQTTGAISTALVSGGNYTALGAGPISFTYTAGITPLFFGATGTLTNAITLPTANVETRFSGSAGGRITTFSGLITGGNASATLRLDNNTAAGVGRFKFTNASNTFTMSRFLINRGGLEFTSDGALGNANNDLTLDVTNTADGTGLIFGADNITLNSARAVTVATTTVINTQAFTGSRIDGPMTVTGQTIKTGTGNLILNGTGSGTGGLQINAGTVQVGNGGTTGSITTPVNANGAATTLSFNRSDAVTYGAVLSGTGSLVQSGTGTLTLSAANTFTGATTVNAGTLNVTGSSAAAGTIAINGGTFKFGAAADPIGTYTAASLTQSAGNLSLDVSAGSKDTLNLTGNYTTTGGGIMVNVLAAPNVGVPYNLVNYTGTLSAHPPVTFTGLGGSRLAGTVDYGTGTNSVISVTFNGVIGNLVWTGANGTSWDTTAQNWLNGGSGDAFFQQDAVFFDDSASNFTPVLSGTLQPSSVVFSNASNTYTLSGSGSLDGNGTLSITGGGTVVVNNTNTLTGQTTITAGILQIGNGGTSGSLGTGPVANNASLVFNRSDTAVFPNSVTGSGTITQSGTGTTVLTGDINSSGFIWVATGALQVGNGGTTGSIGANPSSLQVDTSLIVNRSSATTIAAPISGAGTLTKLGAGALTLSGTNTFTGATTITAGSVVMANPDALAGSPVVFNGGQLAFNFGNGTTTTVSHDFTLPATGQQQFITTAPTSATTVRLTGKISGGTAGQTYRLVDSNVGGNHNNVLTLENPANDFQGRVEIWRGSLVFTSNEALGNPANGIRHESENLNGALRFGADNIVLAATRAIELGGNDDPIDVQAFTGTILGPVSGAGRFVKQGTGRLIMPAAMTTTAVSSIAAGTLQVDGTWSTSASALTVAVPGTLAGIGTINRPVTVNGTLAPGNGVGTLTVGNTTTFGAGSTYAFQIGDWTGAAGTGYDQLASTAVAITATAASKLTVVVDASTMVNFTDANKTFVIATGTQSGLALDNWTVTTTGFSGIGTWKLQVNGNQLELVYALGTPFDNWANSFGSLPANKRGVLDDYDNDGTPNLLEYVLGGNPTLMDGTAIAPTTQQSGSNLLFIYSRSDASELDTTQTVQYGSDLTGWTDVPIGATSGGMVMIAENDVAADTVQVTIPTTGNPKLFVRLKVTKSGS
ncbi:autotransporter-associated beta strand repeat-containing protein [Luteolibacter ambystomatis]|uniref:Autotransporter-associated beta strand repeat-containing protein n=1 Tax=Luteolibacter ambystomatis TaxID=2824561 RepID=A0A975G749_9BACT|nr:autotransporter-associated beta strand repeat-containing protein [Luteolibacter ambystomatis]QUE50319.1 autotransporter-associated beta strand repeat-containing protein [Luteolibacter ambystomatis]